MPLPEKPRRNRLRSTTRPGREVKVRALLAARERAVRLARVAAQDAEERLVLALERFKHDTNRELGYFEGLLVDRGINPRRWLRNPRPAVEGVAVEQMRALRARLQSLLGIEAAAFGSLDPDVVASQLASLRRPADPGLNAAVTAFEDARARFAQSATKYNALVRRFPSFRSED